MSTTAPDTVVGSTYGLVRAYQEAAGVGTYPEACSLRAASTDGAEGASGRTLHGYFSVFDRWYEIDSMFEGRFLERVAPGAFVDTMLARRDQVKVLYDHGHDPQLGNKPLGPITLLEEDKVGARYEVELIETDYNDGFVIPAARAGLLGASFRFKVGAEEWEEPTKASKQNPERLPQRTITRVDPLYEFGPVTFPASPVGTDAGVRMRGLTDGYIDQLLHDPLFLARFTERAGLPLVERLLAGVVPASEQEQTPPPPPPERSEEQDDESAPPATTAEYTPTVRPLRTAERRLADREALEAMLEAAARRD